MIDFEPFVEAVARRSAQLVLEGIADRSAEPAVLDRSLLAARLSCSPSSVDRMRAAGCPHVRIGESPRFELAAVLAWLREREAAK